MSNYATESSEESRNDSNSYWRYISRKETLRLPFHENGRNGN